MPLPRLELPLLLLFLRFLFGGAGVEEVGGEPVVEEVVEEEVDRDVEAVDDPDPVVLRPLPKR